MSNDNKNIMPVFRLKQENKNENTNNDEYYCTIKHVGNLTNNEKLGDQLLEINTTPEMKKAFGDNVYFLGEILDHDIMISVYQCNIIGSYLLTSSKLPIYNICFSYNRTVIRGILFNIFIYFNIDKSKNFNIDSKTNKIKPNSYINATVSGYYTIEIECDTDIKTRYKSLYDNLDVILEKIMTKLSLTQNNFDEYVENNKDTIVKMAHDEQNKIKLFLEQLFNGKIDKMQSRKQFINNYITHTCNNEYMIELIKLAIDVRNKERQKQYNTNYDNLKIPKKVLKLNDILNNPEIVDKYLN